MVPYEGSFGEPLRGHRRRFADAAPRSPRPINRAEPSAHIAVVLKPAST
jgi:hypothetical protein